MLAPSNLGGDCLSEEVGLFEATDGTAPEYAGMDRVNPVWEGDFG